MQEVRCCVGKNNGDGESALGCGVSLGDMCLEGECVSIGC